MNDQGKAKVLAKLTEIRAACDNLMWSLSETPDYGASPHAHLGCTCHAQRDDR